MENRKKSNKSNKTQRDDSRMEVNNQRSPPPPPSQNNRTLTRYCSFSCPQQQNHQLEQHYDYPHQYHQQATIPGLHNRRRSLQQFSSLRRLSRSRMEKRQADNTISSYSLYCKEDDIEESLANNENLSERHYYTIPELEMLSSVVSSFSTSRGNIVVDRIAPMAETQKQQTIVEDVAASSSSTSPLSKLSSIENENIFTDVETETGFSVSNRFSFPHSNYWQCEQSIIGARASVMVYDDTQKKWVPSGTSSGLSKVQIYHHQQNNTFRVVGRKLHDHEVVINCSILKGLKYNQATATFHQWRDSKYVYGLNFSSQQDAEAFARAMLHALEVLSGRVIPTSAPPIPTNGNGYDEDMGYRTMTREDAAIIQQQTVAPSPQTPTSQNNQNIPQSPPTPQGHHRTSSAPPAPQPPPMSIPPQMYSQPGGAGIAGGPPPPQPPAPPQSQYHSSQMLGQQHHPVYPSQQINNTAYPNQYQQPIYVSSSSNQSLNQQLQQQQQQQQPPPVPAHQNGTIYISSQAQGIPSSASSNSVVYASQSSSQLQLQQQPPQLQQQPPPQMSQQQSQQNLNALYGQSNGVPSTNNNDPQYGQIPAAPPMLPSMLAACPPGNGVPIPPQSSSGPGRAAPPAPQAPPPPPAGFGGMNMNNSASVQSIPPPAPPMMMGPGSAGGGGAPPPPPPPPMSGLGGKNNDGFCGMDMSSLASQLQSARLKKNNNKTTPPAENSGSSTSSGGSGNYGTIGRSSKGMASMMDEMAKTLARRRAQAERKEPDPCDDDQNNGRRRAWEKSNTLPHKLGANGNGNSASAGTSNSGSESPRPIRKRFGSASEETILKQVNGEGLSLALTADLDSFKAEIVREMRQEIQKVKQEIIDAIKSEFNRR